MAARCREPTFSMVHACRHLGELPGSLQTGPGKTSRRFLDLPRTCSPGALFVQRSFCPPGHDYRSADLVLVGSVPGHDISLCRSAARKTFRERKTREIARNATASA